MKAKTGPRTPQIILQPCSNPLAQANLRKTILSPVPSDTVLSEGTDINKKDREYFSKPEHHHISIWGVKEKQGRPKEMWERIKKGDIVLFYADKNFILIGTIDYTFTSPKLAAHLWPEDGIPPEFSYKFLYVVKNPLALYTKTIGGFSGGIPSKSLINRTKIEGLGSNGVVMGITVVSEQSAQAFLDRSSIIDEYFKQIGNKRNGYLNFSDPALNAQLDMLTEMGISNAGDGYQWAKYRKERGEMRAAMLKGRFELSCSICGQNYPESSITTAHIKKRSHCNTREMGDYNVVTPMCYLGCDHLFENGYIVVDEQGKVQNNGKGGTSVLTKRIAELAGRDCLDVTDKNRRYYAWHRQFHQSSSQTLVP